MGSLPTHSKPSKSIPMRKLTATLCLTLAVLLGVGGCTTLDSYSGSYGGTLLPCTGNPQIVPWTNCRGYMKLSDGMEYEGDFFQNKPHGQGTATAIAPHPLAGQKQVGEYREGIFHGQGTITVTVPHPEAEQKQVGEFREGKLKRGTITFIAPHQRAGVKYVGELRDKNPHGQGTKTFSEPHRKAGEEKAGIWENNVLMTGTRTFITPHERAGEKEIWKNGSQQKTIYPSKPKQVAKRPQPTKSPPPKSGTTGSGFFVSKLGHIVSNEHIVRQCGSVTVGDNANKLVSASVLEKDKRNDLALLRISSTQMASAETLSLISKLGAQKLGLKLVPLASGGLMRSDDIELGESVLVAGYPYGELYSNTIKVTGGMVSAVKGMGDDSAQFQMDAAVQPGNSGGPIYDGNGNIVGVVISQLNKLKVAKAIGSLPENVNFGIKASTVRQFLTSAGLPTKWSNRTERKSTKELAQIAKNQTVMVVCNP